MSKQTNTQMVIPFKRAVKLFVVFLVAIPVTYGIALIFNFGIGLLENKMFRVLLLLFEPAVMVRRELSEVQQETYIYFLSIGPVDIVGLLIFYFLVCLFIAACWTRMESIIKTRT